MPQQQQQEQVIRSLSINIEFADKRAIDCMLEAIEKLQESMSPSLQQFYDAIKPQPEAKKAEFRKRDTIVKMKLASLRRVIIFLQIQNCSLQEHAC